MTTPCAASKSFWARRMFGFCRNARLTASASESGWGMKALVVDEEGGGWAGSAETGIKARTRSGKASSEKRFFGIFRGRGRGGRNPKPEGRSPKEVRMPKAETTGARNAIGLESPRAVWHARLCSRKYRVPGPTGGLFGLWTAGLFRVSDLGLRVCPYDRASICSAVTFSLI